MHEGMLELRYGLLNRRSRRLDPARIQNIEIVRNPLHKMSGLVGCVLKPQERPVKKGCFPR